MRSFAPLTRTERVGLQGHFAVFSRLGRSSHHLGTVVPDVTDLRVRLVDFHFFRLVRSQQIERQPFRLLPVEPAIVVPRLENHRHARVNSAHHLVRLRDHDGEGLEPVTSAVLPRIPQARKGEGPTVRQLEGVGLLRRLPFFRVE